MKVLMYVGVTILAFLSLSAFLPKDIENCTVPRRNIKVVEPSGITVIGKVITVGTPSDEKIYGVIVTSNGKNTAKELYVTQKGLLGFGENKTLKNSPKGKFAVKAPIEILGGSYFKVMGLPGVKTLVYFGKDAYYNADCIKFDEKLYNRLLVQKRKRDAERKAKEAERKRRAYEREGPPERW